jgi:hypothetical protein
VPRLPRSREGRTKSPRWGSTAVGQDSLPPRTRLAPRNSRISAQGLQQLRTVDSRDVGDPGGQRLGLNVDVGALLAPELHWIFVSRDERVSHNCCGGPFVEAFLRG